MNRMRSGTILLLFSLLFFSCKESKKTIQISEKDLDGYWVSGFLLHNTELSRSIASGNEKKPQVLLLRLKNAVNGFADTSFRIHGDTLFYRTKTKYIDWNDSIVGKNEFGSFRVVFYSKERIVLYDESIHLETTYYNGAILKDNNDALRELRLNEYGVKINDSVQFIGPPFMGKVRIEPMWKSDLDFIVRRINWSNALFARNSVDKKYLRIGEFEIQTPIPHFVKIGISTKRHEADFSFSSQFVSDPALTILISEMDSFENWYKLNHKLGNRFCGM